MSEPCPTCGGTYDKHKMVLIGRTERWFFETPAECWSACREGTVEAQLARAKSQLAERDAEIAVLTDQRDQYKAAYEATRTLQEPDKPGWQLDTATGEALDKLAGAYGICRKKALLGSADASSPNAIIYGGQTEETDAELRARMMTDPTVVRLAR